MGAQSRDDQGFTSPKGKQPPSSVSTATPKNQPCLSTLNDQGANKLGKTKS